MENQNTNLLNDVGSFRNATGPIIVTLKNDMMFHRVMHSSKKALKGLICALKGLNPVTVRDVQLMNPIDYAEYRDKEIILDVKVLLENKEILDIELQLYRDKYWEQRSLLYLCRSFAGLGEGDKYNNLKPTTLVAIMDDPLFEEHPEFYSKYILQNIKNHEPYSSMLNLNVLYLNQTDLATEDDRKNDLVYWAELFKATTWEDLIDLCNDRPEFEEVATAMYKTNTIPQERTIMEAHERYVLDKQAAFDTGFDSGYDTAKEEDNEIIGALNAEKCSLINDKSELIKELNRLRKKMLESGIEDT